MSYQRSLAGTVENQICDRCGEVGDESTWSFGLHISQCFLCGGFCKPCSDLVQGWLREHGAAEPERPET